MTKAISILGIRGIPAAHGGFETFAEHLAVFLRDRGWAVTVFCQKEGKGAVFEDEWDGIRRINVPVAGDGSLSTMTFDWKATRLAARDPGGIKLTLGYNTALFCGLLRVGGIPNIINMDGIEWARAKWGPVAKVWFWLNERAGCWLGNHLVADHPEIKRHLSSRVRESKITMIPYGADPVLAAPEDALQALGLQPGRFLTLIARPEPENSVLEVVRGFSARPRGYQLVILGKYDRARNPYHQAVQDAASDEVRFVGAIYDKAVVQALRFHGAAYVHGHQVGGTNPSLVEALGAGNAVIAHDNRFNRWVAGSGAVYFDGADGFAKRLEELLADESVLQRLRLAGRARFEYAFTWQKVLEQYEALLTRWLRGEVAPSELPPAKAEPAKADAEEICA